MEFGYNYFQKTWRTRKVVLNIGYKSKSKGVKIIRIATESIMENMMNDKTT
jgi:uncharacterized protein YggU (UPF0235/DUF167 family)